MIDSVHTENYKLPFCRGCALTMFGTLDLGPGHSRVMIKTSPDFICDSCLWDATKTLVVGQFHLQISLKLQRTSSYLLVETFKCLLKKFTISPKKIFEAQMYFKHILLRKQMSIFLVPQNMKKRPYWHLCTIISTQDFLFPVISCSRGWEGNISWSTK